MLDPDRVQQTDAIPIRQPDIQQDAVILEQAQFLLCRLQRIAQLTDISLPRQEVVDIPGQLLMIFDDKDLHGAKITYFPSRLTGTPSPAGETTPHTSLPSPGARHDCRS